MIFLIQQVSRITTMNKDNLPHYDLIEAYLENRLNETEKIHFQANLSTDHALQEELLLYKQIVAGIKLGASKRLKEKLEKADELLENLNIAAEPKAEYKKENKRKQK